VRKQRAEASRLELALQASGEQLVRSVLVDRRREQRLTNRLAARLDQAGERISLLLRRVFEAALAGDLCVA